MKQKIKPNKLRSKQSAVTIGTGSEKDYERANVWRVNNVYFYMRHVYLHFATFGCVLREIEGVRENVENRDDAEKLVSRTAHHSNANHVPQNTTQNI